MLRIVCLVTLLAVLVPSGALVSLSDITANDISRSLPERLEHPYLFFTEAEKPAILDRIENDPNCAELMAQLRAESNRLLHTPVKPIPPQPMDRGPQLFDQSGDFTKIYYDYRSAAHKLAFVYQMTGDERYARKSYEFAREVCDMPTWVLRLCQYPKAYYRVSPWNAIDDKVVFTFGIVSSDTSSLIATVYDWIYPSLTRDERDWIRGGLLQNAIVQVRGNYEYHWWSTAYRCNWCAWCNTGLGLAALTLLTEDPHLTDVAAESFNRLSRTLDQIGIDGGWQEGGSYWGQTTRMSILFGDALRRLTGGAHDMFKHPKLSQSPVNFPLYLSIPPDRSVNFADASGRHHVGSARLYNKIALESGNGSAAWMRDNWYGAGGDIFDIIWPKHTATPALPDQTSIHFRTIDWVIMRSDFTDPGKVVVACKAGKNDDPHHGHLDVGQFVIFRNGTAYISDHGPAAYDEKFFDAEKYDTPQASSIGHNLIFVNGERQITGKHFRQPLDESIGGEILVFRPGDKRDYTLMDPTNAYPKRELKKWRRHIILVKPDITVVVDEIKCAAGAEIEARFHSECQQVVSDGYTLLDGEIGDMALIPIVDGDFSFRPDRHAYQALFKTASFQWIPFNGTVVEARSDRTILAHVILPVSGDKEAATVARSVTKTSDDAGNYRLSFRAVGMKHTFNFVQGNDGFILEK
ncbi:heparinase II/III family protein [Candidatus Latescibacterota bacterium]